MGTFVIGVFIVVASGAILGTGRWLWRKWRADTAPLQTSFPFDVVTSADDLAERLLDRADEWAIEYLPRYLPDDQRTTLAILDKEPFALIRGRTGSGKTREVLELVRQMENRGAGGIVVLIPHNSPAVPPFEWPMDLKSDHVLLLLEDLHNRRFIKAGESTSSDDYARWLPVAIDELGDRVGTAGEFRVIGTIREEVFPKSGARNWREHIGRDTDPMWKGFAEIQLPELPVDVSANLSAGAAAIYGVTLTEGQSEAIAAGTDGRPASVVGPFRTMDRGHSLTDTEVQEWARSVEEQVERDWALSIDGYPRRRAVFEALDLLAQAGATSWRESVVELAARLTAGREGSRFRLMWLVRRRIYRELRQVDTWVREGAGGTLVGLEPYYQGRAKLDEQVAVVVTALRYRFHVGGLRLAADLVNLATALQALTTGDRRANIEFAIGCYDLILGAHIREAFPAGWATIQNNLGNAYAERIAGDQTGNVEQAIAYYTRSLEVRTRTAFPAEWAMNQNNLGTAFSERIAGDHADNIEQAIAAYNRSLEVRTREASPTNWAITQNNLGATYRVRIKGEGRDNIEQAIACFTRSLEVQTREAAPVDWAAVQNNLGNAYAQSEAEDRVDKIELSIACYARSLEVYTKELFPADWAMAQNNLGGAYMNRIVGEHANNIEKAIECFTRSLIIRTREAFPVDWAMTQFNLGSALTERIAGDKSDNIERAIACFTRSLEVRGPERHPAEWAMVQINLGNAYAERIAGESSNNIKEAIACYTRALEVYTEEAWPERHQLAKNNLDIATRKRNERQTGA